MASHAHDPVADELAIRNVVARYADAVWRRDGEAWEATWAPEARWSLPGGHEVTGRAKIRAAWERAMSRYPTVVQLVHQGEVIVDGDSASGRWFLAERGTTIDGDPIDHVGTYDDIYVRTADGWRFASRHFEVVAVGTAGLSPTDR